MRQRLLLLLLLAGPWVAGAHKRRGRLGGCGHEPPVLDRLEMQIADEEYVANRRRRLKSTTIDVYVVNFMQDAKTQKFANKEIVDLIKLVNDYYKNTGFQFKFRDMQQIQDTALYDCAYNTRKTWMKQYRQSSKTSLTIFFCNVKSSSGGTTDNDSDSISGWSSWPTQAGSSTDGIVVKTPFGTGGNGDDSLALVVHMTGHWMGLLHTFSGGCKNKRRTVSGLEVKNGDGVADTPAHSGPTDEQSGESTCWVTTPALNTCADTISGIDKGDDPVKNWMNSLSTKCFLQNGEFTKLQAKRMQALYTTFRSETNGGDGGPSRPGCAKRGKQCTSDESCCSGLRCVTNSRSRAGERITTQQCRRTCYGTTHTCENDSQCCDGLVCRERIIMFSLQARGAKYCTRSAST